MCLGVLICEPAEPETLLNLSNCGTETAKCCKRKRETFYKPWDWLLLVLLSFAVLRMSKSLVTNESWQVVFAGYKMLN